MSKLPNFQLYTGDWMKDPALRSISEGARGLWIDLLCLMHEAPVRGVLAHYDGTPFSIRDISRATGIPEKRIPRYMSEFERVGLCSFSEQKAIISRRQVRDEVARERDRDRKAATRKAAELSQSVRTDSVPCPKDIRPLSAGSSSSVPVPDPNSEVLTKREREFARAAPPSPAVWAGDEDPGSGRRILAGHPNVWIHEHELDDVRAMWLRAGMSSDEFAAGLKRCNVELESKRGRSNFRGGIAYKYLSTFILTEALEQRVAANGVNGHGAPRRKSKLETDLDFLAKQKELAENEEAANDRNSRENPDLLAVGDVRSSSDRRMARDV